MKDAFRHEHFIRRFVQQGLTYRQSEIAYKAMINSFEEAMSNRRSVSLGRVGQLKPKTIKPRAYKMGCLKKKGGVKDPNVYTYYVGIRTTFIFKMHEAFGIRHGFR